MTRRVRRGPAPKHRKAKCHPDRPHMSRDLCNACYLHWEYLLKKKHRPGLAARFLRETIAGTQQSK